MTSRRRPADFLRLVESTKPTAPVDVEVFKRPTWQSTLFAAEHPALLAFVHLAEVKESDFLALLTAIKPKFIFDLRRVPRFDIGNLNRRLVFSLFAQNDARYVDLTGRIDARGGAHPRDDPRSIFEHLIEWRARALGPAAFLLDASEFNDRYISDFADALPPAPEGDWDIAVIPANTQQGLRAADRNLIFISHANPQDNDFAAWLTSRLSLAGYEVWSDLASLRGGDIIWSDIEETIRTRAARVLVVLSRSSQTKPGVLDEVDLAVRVERTNGWSGFVIPLLIDDLPFGEVRANLARKLILDFHSSWATGLSALLSSLERDGIHRSHLGDVRPLGDWVLRYGARRQDLQKAEERLFTNWLPFYLPGSVQFYDIAVASNQIDAFARSLQVATFRHLRLLGSFADGERLRRGLPLDAGLSEQYRIGIDEFRSGKNLLGISPNEARKHIVSLARQDWDLRTAKAGALPYETASGSKAWYLPKSHSDADQVSFVDSSGKTRRRKLVGWSERRQVYWHFAIDAKPALYPSPHYILRPHVIFTSDGTRPIESNVRMHSLRRSFCRSWWNDRWRDLILAYVSWLSFHSLWQANGEIPVGASLLEAISPVAVAEPPNAESIEESAFELNEPDDPVESDDFGEANDPLNHD